MELPSVYAARLLSYLVQGAQILDDETVVKINHCIDYINGCDDLNEAHLAYMSMFNCVELKVDEILESTIEEVVNDPDSHR